MKNKLIIALCILLLGVTSVSSYFVFCYAYLVIGGALYQVRTDGFNIDVLKYFILGLTIIIVFFVTFLPPIIYLCKQLFKIKKWLVVIPILASILIALLSIVLVWWNFQWE